ncbi:hydantoinase B/oxoprolinase family protein [Amycolatopsis alkalitolerans]|uniref:Hydantoinase B/oxoprolinase family protein n=1 Tax=Amycolatopsis alkalitolerans TaxID=2547244 RepID=A0A5C4M877_9PSEU|nr:hydantoinase B/oxoprolinase family protein [Amycolatopsis alkalitolerans]TNC29195.1 hydantoinase B/oxoprolinase family protein [Amycolatopsis alkalitolerans]
MTMHIPGSAAFASRPIDPLRFAGQLPDSPPRHTVTDEQIEALDPLTYEVIRHRLWSVTDEMGETLKRMSGSPVVTDANDFDFAISDELGQEVQVGLYNTMLAGAVDLAIYWTLRNRTVREGDMFLCNDPWVGGGLHQNDVIVFQPIFVDGRLFAWTSAVCHEPDLGGVGLGSFDPAAQDVFSEAVPTPPVRVVRDFELQEDIADLWIRRSRVPLLVGLDLRAKVGANTVGRNRLEAVVEQYGADTVKAVMKRMMNDAEQRLRDKLRRVPDGTWHATGYQDQAREGDRGVHKITVAMTKKGDHLTFDFTGTDPQAGVINCTYAGMRGGAMLALLPVLAHDIPWSAGGLLRCFDIVSEEGTLNNATFPAAVSRGPIGPAWLTGSLIAECLSQMLDRTVEFGDSVQASCCGTHDTAVLAGVDARGGEPAPFINIVMDVMAAGYGARPRQDGMDTGGLNCIPMGRIPDVEMVEYLYPLMTLWRREEPDSGGPGRHRGGVSGSSAMIPYGTGTPMGLVVASSGKGVAQNNGLAGGYPGNTAIGIVARGSSVKAAFRSGILPTTLEIVAGTQELRACYDTSYLAPDDVLYLNWQGGGGYGDPVLREPSAVLADYHAGKVTADGSAETYGVVLSGDTVDEAATGRRRAEIRRHRATQATIPAGEPRTVDLATAVRLDDNLAEVRAGGGLVVACRHCGRQLGDARTDATLALARLDGPARAAGPQVTADPATYLDDEVVFRQLFCPGCWTAVYSGLVPADHPDHALDIGRLMPSSASR